MRYCRQKEKGLSALTVIFFGTIALAVTYYAYNVMPIYYGYYELENHMNSIIRLSDELNDIEVRKRLLITIREQQIPLLPENIIITREDNYMTISAEYKKVFRVKFGDKTYWKQEFKFAPHAEGNY